MQGENISEFKECSEADKKKQEEAILDKRAKVFAVLNPDAKQVASAAFPSLHHPPVAHMPLPTAVTHLLARVLPSGVIAPWFRLSVWWNLIELNPL